MIETQQSCITSTGGLRQSVIQYLNSREHTQGLLLAPNGKPAVFMISFEDRREPFTEFDVRPCCRKQICAVHTKYTDWLREQEEVIKVLEDKKLEEQELQQQ